MDKINKLNMDTFFHLSPNREQSEEQDVFSVSTRLRHMSQNELLDIIEIYGMKPIYQYVVGHIKSLDDPQLVSAVFTYIDTYLISQTGGDRRKLQKLAKDEYGLDIPIATSKLMRLSITNHILYPNL